MDPGGYVWWINNANMLFSYIIFYILFTWEPHDILKSYSFYFLLLSNINSFICQTSHLTLHNKWSFPLRVSSVNAAKSAVSHSLRKSLLEDFILSTEWLFIIQYRNIGNYFHYCLTKFQIRQFLLLKQISHSWLFFDKWIWKWWCQ